VFSDVPYHRTTAKGDYAPTTPQEEGFGVSGAHSMPRSRRAIGTFLREQCGVRLGGGLPKKTGNKYRPAADDLLVHAE